MAHGDASKRVDPSKIDAYLAAARKAHARFIIDIQPGHRAFLPEAKHYARWLKEPDVSLALDSEWKLPDGVAPGSTLGSTDAAAINGVSSWLADFVKDHDLPQKMLIVHRFTPDMIANASRDRATRRALDRVQHRRLRRAEPQDRKRTSGYTASRRSTTVSSCSSRRTRR